VVNGFGYVWWWYIIVMVNNNKISKSYLNCNKIKNINKVYKGYMLSYKCFLYDNSPQLFGPHFPTSTLLLLRREKQWH